MRIVTYQAGGETRLGAVRRGADGEMVVDLARAEPRLPADMLSFLQMGDEALWLAARALADPPPGAETPLAATTLKAPLTPGKIICVGRNYVEHAAEAGQAPPPQPIIFAKFNNTIIGPNEPIVLPHLSDKIDFEGELAAVIGRRARNVAEADALSYVAGYTGFNDVSARDIQRQTSQWTLGKSFDTFGPTGPALVTVDEIPDPQALDLRLSINGEMMQAANTGIMIFSIAYLISYLSAHITLEPGDLIATGTPGGVGYARTPPRWLRPGDVVRLEIERVGILENPVTEG